MMLVTLKTFRKLQWYQNNVDGTIRMNNKEK